MLCVPGHPCVGNFTPIGPSFHTHRMASGTLDLCVPGNSGWDDIGSSAGLNWAARFS